MKFHRFAICSVAAVVALALCSCGRDREKTILMVTEATFPPYEFREGNEIVGIDIDIMREVARVAGKKLVIEDMSFDSVIPAVRDGKADAAASGITITEERKQQIAFSLPYAASAQVMIVSENSPVKGREDLKGKRIGVQTGTTGEEFVARNIRQPERFPNAALAIAALGAGKIDVVVLDEEPAKIYTSHNPGLKILGEPLTTEEYAVAVRRGNTELLEQINAVIRELKANGGLEAIRARY